MKPLPAIFTLLLLLFLSPWVQGEDLFPAPGGVAPPSPRDLEAVERSFGRLPLYFVENQGQLHQEVAYYVQGTDKSLFFTSQGLTISLHGESAGPDRAWAVKLSFLGIPSPVKPRGEEKQEAVISYFKGLPDTWKTRIPTFGKVVYSDLWPGIDLVYTGMVNQLKYAFLVKPGADPEQIRLAYRGVDAISVQESGALLVSTPAGSFEDAKPAAYQEEGGIISDIPIAYELMPDAGRLDSFVYGFQVGEYDPEKVLVLDPTMLAFCGYIGGSTKDKGCAIALDSAGNTYIAGDSASSEATFPVNVGPDLTYDGGGDFFVAKVNASGTALVYCGYIGGTGSEEYDTQGENTIAVDSSGCAYVTGATSSPETEFPVKNGPGLVYNGGTKDAFVAKVYADGTDLHYCGYIGGSESDRGKGIAVDGSGNAYVTGVTLSSESTFPVINGPDLTFNDTGGAYEGDVFVAKVVPDGTGFAYCGYIGGADEDVGTAITVDGSGKAYLTGFTLSAEDSFPVSGGPDLTYNGTRDVFVAAVAANGLSLAYCGYIGGTEDERSFDLAVDGLGNAYVTGSTNSAESDSFPVEVGPDLTFNGGFYPSATASSPKSVPTEAISSTAVTLAERTVNGGTESPWILRTAPMSWEAPHPPPAFLFS